MPNRRANKKLRARVLSRMSETGESYQKALGHLLARGGAPDPAPPAGAGAERPRRPSVREVAPLSPLLLYQQAVALLSVADQARWRYDEASSRALHAEAMATFVVYWRASGKSAGLWQHDLASASRELRAGAELVDRLRSAHRRPWIGHPPSALVGAASRAKSGR